VTVAAGTVHEALGAASDALAAAGVESPRLDAEVLLAEATGLDRAALVAEPEAGIDPAAARSFGGMVRRRVVREPVAYILGRKGFRHIELAVDRRVLIPRPETELLVELAVELGPGSVLDVGTGSGAVALAIADELPEVAVTGTDTSADAIDIARANADRLGLSERVGFQAGTVAPGPFDLVVANLPYVADGDWPALAPEIRDWEPREALLAGTDGLAVIRQVAPVAAEALVPGGALALEVGLGQAPPVAALLADLALADIEVRQDLAGIDRVVWGRGA
jgi:release factor glutamine methyltransferase